MLMNKELLMNIFFSACRFFISAPNVFHVGVSEKVFVQMGDPYLNTNVAVYLEHEQTGTLMSTKEHVVCRTENDIKMVELTV